MVATNLAARGLETSQVSHVIQFELARTTLDYFHRAGRLARLGQQGSMMTNFIRHQDSEIAKQIVKCLRNENNLDKVISSKPPRKKKINNNN